MRTKEEILKHNHIGSEAMQLHAILEVLIDIRDLKDERPR